MVKGDPAAATRAAVDLMGGLARYVKPGARVLIKPNMSFPSTPERASNTHPQVVRELVMMCGEAGASEILVLDHPLGPEEACLEYSGIRKACENIKRVEVRAVSREGLFKEVDIPNAHAMRKTDVMREALKADVIIAAPVAKSHSAAGVSLSLKGMMGLVYDRRSMHWRYDLDKAIVDLCTVIKADLVVIDGTRVLSTGGPGGPGKVLKERTVIASTDMVAADACAVSLFKWYGRKYQPRQVPHIREAHQRKIGRMDLENLMIKTVSL